MRLLIFATDRTWISLARVPKILQEAGFEVAVLCPPDSYLAHTRYVNQRFLLETRDPGPKLLQALIQAVEAWQPVLVIPGDDPTVQFLQQVVRITRAGKLTTVPDRVLQAIESSLCHPDYYDAATNKSVTQQVAIQLGVRVPGQQQIEQSQDALDFAQTHGYPVVVKKAFSYAGHGVRICETEAQLVETLHQFLPQLNHQRSPETRTGLKTRLRRALIKNPLAIAEPTPDLALSIQQYIRGTAAMYCFLAKAGKLLGGYAALKKVVHPAPTGPSSIVQFIDHPEMATVATILAAQFEYTGFGSFEFIVEEGTGDAYFLECNPRPTTIVHLGDLVGNNLCKVLYDSLRGELPTAPILAPNTDLMVAMFPKEWQRDPNSQFLRSLYHDVPWDDPELIAAYIKYPQTHG